MADRPPVPAAAPPVGAAPAPDTRWEAGCLWFAVGAIGGYALLRIGAWWAGEPDPRMILASAHVAWYWRVTTALWWGVLAGAAGVRFGGLALARRFLPAAVLLGVVQAVLVA